MQGAPFDPTQPVEGFLTLSADGKWLYKGEPVTHPGLVSILESNYRRDETGRYLVYLQLPNGTQKVAVELEDVPYYVRDIDWLPNGEGRLRLNDGTAETLRPESMSIGENGGTYAKVKDGVPARFLRQAELRLESVVQERDGILGVQIGARWTPLPLR